MPFEPENDLSYKKCTLCSGLADTEEAYQEFGWEDNNTYLPEASKQLKLIRALRPIDSRELHLWQCPQCGTYYLHQYDYEYFADGSQDEEHLMRLTFAQAAEYLNQPAEG